MSTASTEQAPRRPSFMGPNETEAAAGLAPAPPALRSLGCGTDVTPTSPSASGSLVSIRPLPSPGPYQASLMTPREEETRAPTPRPSTAPFRSSAPSLPSSLSSCASPTPASMVDTSMATAGSGKHKENTGRWLAEEHDVFLKGLNEHGKQWKKIAVMIKTRSVVQVRTHAQKYFQKLLKSEKKEDGRPGKDLSSSVSTSTASSTAGSITASPSEAIKRKSSTKGGKTVSSTTPAKKRRVSLEPKPKKLHASSSIQPHYQAPYVPGVHVAAPTPTDHTAIDPSFMNTLGDGEFDESM